MRSGVVILHRKTIIKEKIDIIETRKTVRMPYHGNAS